MVDRSNGWPPVSTSEAVAALRGAGLDVTSAVRIEDGISSWTFDVDEGRYVARFPRTVWVAAGHARERALLPALAGHVSSFRVPEPLPVGDGFIVYERLPGRPLRADDDQGAVRAMVEELQSFPVERAERLLDGALAWRERLQRHRASLTAAVHPHLSAAEMRAVDDMWERSIAGSGWTPTLVHGDLFPEHVLIDEDGTPTAMIDFEDSSIGDPAVDHAGFLHHLDWAAPPALAERAWWAAIRVDLWFAAGAEDDADRETHLEALRRRLDAGPRR